MKIALAFDFNTCLWLLTQCLQIKVTDIVKYQWSLVLDQFNWLIDSSKSWWVDSYLHFRMDLFCCWLVEEQDCGIRFIILLLKLCRVKQSEQTNVLDLIFEFVEDLKVIQLFRVHKRNISSHHNKEVKANPKYSSWQDSYQKFRFECIREMFWFNQQLPMQFLQLRLMKTQCQV